MEKEKNKDSADPRPDEMGKGVQIIKVKALTDDELNAIPYIAKAKEIQEKYGVSFKEAITWKEWSVSGYDRLGIRKIWESETDLQKRLDLLESERQREFSMERFAIIEALEKWTKDLIFCEAQFNEALTKDSEGEAKRYLLRLAAPDDLADPPTLQKMTFKDFQKEMYRQADRVADEYTKRREQAERERFNAPEIIELLNELGFLELEKWQSLGVLRQSEVLSKITGTSAVNIRKYYLPKPPPDEKRTKKIKDLLKVGS